LCCNSSDVKGQSSRSHEAKDKFVGLAETSLSTPFGQVAFLDYIYSGRRMTFTSSLQSDVMDNN